MVDRGVQPVMHGSGVEAEPGAAGGDPPLPQSGPQSGTEVEAEAVVRRVVGGDRSAWEDLIRLYARRIYAAARSRLKSSEAAEEVTQSVLATVHESISRGRYRDEGRFESWLFRIVMNRVRDEARRRARDLRLTRGLADRPRPASPGDDEQTHTNADLLRAIAALPEADQEVISLRHHAGLSFTSIAAMLGTPMGTVLARHHRALKKLKGLLEQDGDLR